MAAIGVEAVEDLPGQFAGRREHQHPAALGLRADAVLQQSVQDRQREGCRLAGSGLGDADHVAAGKCERDGLGLDGGRRQIIFFSERAGDGIGEAEILKGGQKVVLSIKAVIVPGKIAWNRMKHSGTPACLGRQAGLAERRARSRLGRHKNTQLAKAPRCRGHGEDMDQELGGFKMISPGTALNVRRTIAQSVTNRCRKFSHKGNFAYKIT